MIKRRKIAVNGCFDVITKAHCHFLNFAKSFRGELVVGLNNNKSVKQLKGPHRPINKQDDRRYVLLSLMDVDRVVIVDDVNMVNFLKSEKPDIWVKTGKIEDLKPEELAAAKEIGCEIKFMPFIEGYSSSNVIEKMND